jgi:hypothetical protein
MSLARKAAVTSAIVTLQCTSSVHINGWCRWSAFSARWREEPSGERELVSLPQVDSEVHRVRLAVPGAAEGFERQVVLQVEGGPVALFEALPVAECGPPVGLRSRVAHWAPRRGLRQRLVPGLVFLRHVAALWDYSPWD